MISDGLLKRMKEASLEFDNPLNIVGGMDFDEFMNWLDIVDEMESSHKDKIRALNDTKKHFEKFNLTHHIKVIQIKIDSYETN